MVWYIQEWLLLCNVFMSITNEITYVSFYVIFVPRQGSLHQLSLTAPGVSDLLTSCYNLHIGTAIHRGVLQIHNCSLTYVTTISSNMWLVLTTGIPPLSGTTGQEKNTTPNNSAVSTNKLRL